MLLIVDRRFVHPVVPPSCSEHVLGCDRNSHRILRCLLITETCPQGRVHTLPPEPRPSPSFPLCQRSNHGYPAYVRLLLSRRPKTSPGEIGAGARRLSCNRRARISAQPGGKQKQSSQQQRITTRWGIVAESPEGPNIERAAAVRQPQTRFDRYHTRCFGRSSKPSGGQRWRYPPTPAESEDCRILGRGDVDVSSSRRD